METMVDLSKFGTICIDIENNGFYQTFLNVIATKTYIGIYIQSKILD